jgi:hypothetical protein
MTNFLSSQRITQKAKILQISFEKEVVWAEVLPSGDTEVASGQS